MQRESSETRTCRECGAKKTADAFCASRHGRPWCKQCMAAYERARRARFTAEHPNAPKPAPRATLERATCRRCREEKPGSEFSTHWRKRWCKRCYAEVEIARNRRRGMQPAHRVEHDAEGRRRCAMCFEFRPADEFWRPRSPHEKPDGYCKACMAIRTSRWRAANPERAKESVRTAWERNGPIYRARRAAWVAANREVVRQAHRAWIAKNRAHVAVVKARSYAKNPGPTKQRAVRWAKANQDRVHLYQSLRRARMASTDTDTFTAIDWLALQELFDFRCAYCWKRPVTMHQDHVDPLARGGMHGPSNIVPACPSCNQHKQRKNLLEFLLYRDRLIDSGVLSLRVT